jgi:hypothetical protein
MKDTERVKLASSLYECWRKLLPDSRVAPLTRRTVSGPFGTMEEIFCASCATSGGLISQDYIEVAFYLCDDCVFRYGKLPFPEVPEDLLRGDPHPEPGG